MAGWTAPRSSVRSMPAASMSPPERASARRSRPISRPTRPASSATRCRSPWQTETKPTATGTGGHNEGTTLGRVRIHFGGAACPFLGQRRSQPRRHRRDLSRDRARVPSGVLADFVPRRRHFRDLGDQQLGRRLALRPLRPAARVLPAALWVCLMTAAMGGAVGFLSMFIVRDLLGIGDGIGWSVGESTISEESATQRRGFNQALFTAGYTLIGAGLGALIITRISAGAGLFRSSAPPRCRW